jgi:2-polyprenyl-3-methyl-5-hydroxy-6-metoxy-1,4-benzoquinol methylase
MKRNLNKYEDEYINQPYEKYQVNFRKKKIIEILGNYNHKTTLEIGCGLESIFHAYNTFDKLIILEPGLKFYEKAKIDIEKNGLNNIEIFNLYLEDSLELLSNFKFDFIIISSLLHEIPNPKLFLSIIKKISNSNTVIHINVPNANSFHRLLAVEMGLINSVFELSKNNLNFQQQNVFDIKKLVNIVQDLDFKIIESFSYSFKPFTHNQMQKMLDSKLLTEEMLEGFYKLENKLPGIGSEIGINIKL